MSLTLLTFSTFGVGFPYPRPYDGKARNDLQSEIDRILHNSNIDSFEVVVDTKDVSISFATDEDRNLFYKEMEKLSSYSIDNIFSHPTSEFTIRRVFVTRDSRSPV